MIAFNNILTYILTVFYFITVWVYAKAFFKSNQLAKKIKSPFLYTTLGLHGFYLMYRTLLFDHPPITTVFEIMSIIAFSITLAYAVIEYNTKVKDTGYFILTLSFFFQLFSTLFIENLNEVKPILRNNLLGLHVSSALIGYSAFAIAAVYGFLYLMLYHDIKSKHFGVIYNKLPDLEQLERMTSIANIVGFILLTVAIIVGVVWLPKAFGSIFYSDPKLIGTLCIWGMYALGFTAKKIVGWHGKKIMILSIIGFAVSFFSLTIINIYFSGFHKFY